MATKLVVLENSYSLSKTVTRIIADFTSNPDNIKIYNKFDNRSDDEMVHFFEDILACDIILTETTLLNKYQVNMMAKLLSKIAEPKQILFTYKTTVDDLFEYLKDDEIIAKIDHHNIGYYGMSKNPKSYDYEIMNTEQFRAQAVITRKIINDRLELERIMAEKEKAYNDGAINRPTGLKAKILRILACGNAWKTLVPGTVVDVLDMSETDPNPNRGIWVWGDGQPVKLLYDDGYKEYEIITSDLNEVAAEILKRVGIYNPTASDAFALMGVISDALGQAEPEVAMNENITAWLDDKKLERRGNRSNILQLIWKTVKK